MKRVDFRAHQTIAIFGCGPIGLITAAVAHAYSARKIVAFDHNPERVKFAQNYISPITGKPIIDLVVHNGAIPDGPLPSANSKSGANANGHAAHDHKQENGHGAGVTDGEIPPEDEDDHGHSAADTKWEWAKLMVADWVEQAGLTEEEGFDRVIEATGSQDPVMFAIAAAKQGGNCRSLSPLPDTCVSGMYHVVRLADPSQGEGTVYSTDDTDLAVGLGHEQTK